MKPWIGKGTLLSTRPKTFGQNGKFLECLIEIEWEGTAQGSVTAEVPMGLFGKAQEQVKGLRDLTPVEFCGYLIGKNGYPSWRLEWIKAAGNVAKENASEKLNYQDAGSGYREEPKRPSRVNVSDDRNIPF